MKATQREIDALRQRLLAEDRPEVDAETDALLKRSSLGAPGAQALMARTGRRWARTVTEHADAVAAGVPVTPIHRPVRPVERYGPDGRRYVSIPELGIEHLDETEPLYERMLDLLTDDDGNWAIRGKAAEPTSTEAVASEERFGIWAGLTERERRKLRRQPEAPFVAPDYPAQHANEPRSAAEPGGDLEP